MKTELSIALLFSILLAFIFKGAFNAWEPIQDKKANKIETVIIVDEVSQELSTVATIGLPSFAMLNSSNAASISKELAVSTNVGDIGDVHSTTFQSPQSSKYAQAVLNPLPFDMVFLPNRLSLLNNMVRIDTLESIAVPTEAYYPVDYINTLISPKARARSPGYAQVSNLRVNFEAPLTH